MILEVAILYVKENQNVQFEADFVTAGKYISSIKGYLHHTLQRCLENKIKYLLLVKWEQVQDHTIGFRNSKEYQEWKKLLHHYYDPFPVVEHYETIVENFNIKI